MVCLPSEDRNSSFKTRLRNFTFVRSRTNKQKKKLERKGFHYLCFNEFLSLEASSKEILLNAFENNFHSVPPDC